MRKQNPVFSIISAAAMALFLFATAAPQAAQAVSVNITSFRGGWLKGAQYGAGAVVTYNGASYIALVKNAGIIPGTSATTWTILDAPGATGAQGPAGPQGKQGPPGPALVIKDSTGAIVGMAQQPQDGSSFFGVFVQWQGHVLLRPISQSGFLVGGSPQLYYASADCSGAPLDALKVSGSLWLDSSFFGDHTVYYADPNSASSVHILSLYSGGCQANDFGNLLVSPWQSLDVSSFLSQFVPPFSVAIN